MKMNCRVGCWRSDSNNDDTLTSSRQISFSLGHRCRRLDTKLLHKDRCMRSGSHRAVCLSFLYRRWHLDCRSSRSEIFKIYYIIILLLLLQTSGSASYRVGMPYRTTITNYEPPFEETLLTFCRMPLVPKAHGRQLH